MNERRLRVYSTAVLVLYAVLSLCLARSALDRVYVCDFGQYWTVAVAALQGRTSQTYDPVALRSFEKELFGPDFPYLQWNYPPTFLFLLLPFGCLPFLPALAAWVLCSVVAFTYVIHRLVGHPATWRLALAFPAVIINVSHGQNGLLTAALFGGGLLCIDSSPVLSGALFALTGYKPHLVVLLPLGLVACRRWRVLAFMILFSLLLIISSCLIFGAATWTGFFHRVLVKAGELEAAPMLLHKMPTVYASLRALGLPAAVSRSAQAIFSLVVFLFVVSLCRRGADSRTAMSLVGLACLLVTPYLYEYDLALLAVPLACFAAERLKDGCLSPQGKLLLLFVYLSPFTGGYIALYTGLPAGLIVSVVFFFYFYKAHRARARVSLTVK